ncbi:MAG: very short patch repair endonuclease [Thermoguttaceae bacterium]|nr:very short patch repair endonuclease [Thermoguttaceae bacterium]
MADRLTKEQRAKCMRNIKSGDTLIEKKLRLALWHKGYRYRKNYRRLPGKPDIVLPKYRIAIFCDSEFFHGKDWEDTLLPQLMRGNNHEFWVRKISRNIIRDKEVNESLRKEGWIVLRFWAKEIKTSLTGCITVIEEAISSKMKNIA